MKRVNNLFEKIISIENLYLADEKARKGKTNNYGVRVHDKNREQNLIALHNALKNKTFKTSKYETFIVREPKEREIFRLPYYPDRIVHHAIMNILEPIWTKTFTFNTYSCIKGRGIHGCAEQVSNIFKKYEGRELYCLKIDIRKFYPSINHDVMKVIIRRKIKDKDLLELLDGIIDSTDGLPIGNYLSQYLANLYFSYFMHWINENEKVDCTEYADDIVFYADNKERLWRLKNDIEKYITTKLKLKIKDNWQIFPVAKNRYDKHGRALDYVGYKFYREQKLMRKGIKQNFCRRIAKISKKSLSDKERLMEVSSWYGWAKYSNSKHLLHKLSIKS